MYKRQLEGLCDGLLEWCEHNKVSLSLPSLRADNFSLGLMERVQQDVYKRQAVHCGQRGCIGSPVPMRCPSGRVDGKMECNSF